MPHATLHLIITLLFAAPADGPQVIVAGTPGQPPPDELIAAARVQLAGVAAVEPGPELPGDQLAAKFAAASSLVAERGAILAVWVERAPVAAAASDAPADIDYVLYAVATRSDRGLIELGRVAAGESGAVDRVLALKIGALVDDILSTPANPSDPDAFIHVLRPVGPVAPSDIGRVGRPAGADTRLRATAELALVSGLGGGNLGAQPGVALGLGARLDRGGRPDRARFLAELYGALRWMSDAELATGAGRVTASEVALAGGGRVLLGVGPLDLGGAFEAGGRRIAARGVAPDGTTGAATRWMPTVRGGVEVRTSLGPRVAARAGLGAELALVRQRFAVLGEPVADYGRARFVGELGVVVSIP